MIDEEIKAYIDSQLESIIERATERALQLLPDVVTNLYMQKIAMQENVRKFYKGNESFLQFQQIVQNTLEEWDSRNPGKNPEIVMQEAIPEIKKRIETAKTVDMNRTGKPTDLSFRGRLNMPDVGEL